MIKKSLFQYEELYTEHLGYDIAAAGPVPEFIKAIADIKAPNITSSLSLILSKDSNNFGNFLNTMLNPFLAKVEPLHFVFWLQMLLMRELSYPHQKLLDFLDRK